MSDENIKAYNPSYPLRSRKSEVPPPRKHITNCAGKWFIDDIILDDEYRVLKVVKIFECSIKLKYIKNNCFFYIKKGAEKEYTNVSELKRENGI